MYSVVPIQPDSPGAYESQFNCDWDSVLNNLSQISATFPEKRSMGSRTGRMADQIALARLQENRAWTEVSILFRQIGQTRQISILRCMSACFEGMQD